MQTRQESNYLPSSVATHNVFGMKRLLLLWLGTFVLCTLLNGTAGRWIATAEEADFGVESTRTAASILKHGEFRDPFVPMLTGPTAHVAPAYPLVYSAVVGTFGTGKPSWWAIRLLTLAVYALQLALLPLLGMELGFSPQLGRIAALLGCFTPLPGSSYKWEALFTGLLLVAIAYTTLLLNRSQTLSLTAALGTLWGVTLLFSPVVIPIFILWGFLILRSLNFRALLLLSMLPLLVISPWILRNYKVFGAFIFIRDDLGTELAVSNNDCASAWLLDNMSSECFAQNHPNANLQLDQRIVEIGEQRFNTERLRLALSWIQNHPSQFFTLSVKRFLYFWFPVSAGGGGLALLGRLIISVFTGASILGLVLMHQARPLAAHMLTACAVSYSLVYYLVHVDLRYRFPILWISFMATAYLLTRRRNTAIAKRQKFILATLL